MIYIWGKISASIWSNKYLYKLSISLLNDNKCTNISGHVCFPEGIQSIIQEFLCHAQDHLRLTVGHVYRAQSRLKNNII